SLPRNANRTFCVPIQSLQQNRIFRRIVLEPVLNFVFCCYNWSVVRPLTQFVMSRAAGDKVMFQTIKKARLSDEIVKQIKETLFAGKLQAGDRLPTERELAEKFETSRASVREALRTLEQEGMVNIKKGASGGIFIADLNHGPVTKSFQ